jgi:hypothetical protein
MQAQAGGRAGGRAASLKPLKAIPTGLSEGVSFIFVAIRERGRMEGRKEGELRLLQLAVAAAAAGLD